MKILKLAFVGMLFLAMSIQNANAIPIISVTKSCGGFWGYDYTSWQREVLEVTSEGVTKYGWVGVCSGRGFSSCKPPGGELIELNNNLNATEADAYDQSVAEDLINQVGETIDASNATGSETFVKLVEGQSFKRVYTLTWAATTITCQDENGNNISLFSVNYYCRVDYVAL